MLSGLEPERSVLVGRAVANRTFVEALIASKGLTELCFFVGEVRELTQIEKLAKRAPEGIRIRSRNLLELPEAIEAAAIDVLHVPDLGERVPAAIRLRNRHARHPLPVTAQIHSLSYTNSPHIYRELILAKPAPHDAIFCSTASGRLVVENYLEHAVETLSHHGLRARRPDLSTLEVPLGVDAQALRGGDRGRGRDRLGLPDAAFVALSIGRFTEYDKMDLFPLLTAFSEHVKRAPDPSYLVLAGASQGTRTAKMAELWAQGLGIASNLRVLVDFPEDLKADLLAAADLFVAPTDNPQETFGLSVVEAMAAGLPIVASDFDGYRDTVNDQATIRIPTRWNSDLEYLSEMAPLLYQRPLHLYLGQSVEVDVSAMRAAFDTLSANGDRRRQMAEAAGAHAARYDWSNVMPRYLEAWRSLRGRAATSEYVGAQAPCPMPFKRLFSHYPSSWGDPERRVVPAPGAEKMRKGRFHYPIYPELRVAFDTGAAAAALRLAKEGIEVRALIAKMQDRGLALWRAESLVAWLIKHALLVDEPQESIAEAPT